ncbi:MAG TPA: hypothetical protein VHT96_18185 [Clostridia bacterium]|nr:hypothetical protein [Clostridia bacterium]
MRNRVNVQTVDRGKVVSIMLLYMMSSVIIISGIIFSIYSLVNNVGFTVLSSRINGAVFGSVVLFLGVRYFLSVHRLKAEVYKAESKFSWNNFRKGKER